MVCEVCVLIVKQLKIAANSTVAWEPDWKQFGVRGQVFRDLGPRALGIRESDSRTWFAAIERNTVVATALLF